MGSATHRTLRERIALVATYGAFFVFMLDLGGSVYEHVLVDRAWPDNPALIQPAQGGIDRRVFWIPIHGSATLLLLVSLWGAWRNRSARIWVLVAAGLYLGMRIWTIVYFVPAALRFETLTELSPAQLEEARRWVSLSLWRLPLVVATTAALWIAARRLERVPSQRVRERAEQARPAGMKLRPQE